MENADPPPILPVKKERMPPHLVAIIILAALGYLGLNIGIWLYARNRPEVSQPIKSSETVIQTPSVHPSPTAVPLASTGRYEFTVSAGGGKSVLVLAGVLDPVDPPMGGKQDFEVTTVKEAEDVVILVTTDTKEKTIRLTKDRQKPNRWRGSWELDDSYLTKYSLNVQGTVNGTMLVVPITFR